jgi:hypothetical protein
LLLLAGLCASGVAAQDFVAVEESDNHPFEYVQGDGQRTAVFIWK